MSLRTSAEFLFGPSAVKIIPLSYDKSTPLPKAGGTALASVAVYGGVGPWDFSGYTIGSVPFNVKIDNAVDAKNTIDLTAALVPAAVTAAELVTAITTKAFTNLTAAVDSRGYVKLSLTVPGTKRYLQIYGTGALTAEFGQGYGAKFLLIDTQQSFSMTPTMKEAETITTTDSNGKDTEVITDSYRKGFTGSFVDTARDPDLKAVVEGGVYNSTAKTYTPPTSESEKAYFAVEILRPMYSKGTNKEADLIGYLLVRGFSCVGEIGEDAGDRNFSNFTYNVTATEYKDPVSGTIYGDSLEEKFTVAQLETLDWYNV